MSCALLEWSSHTLAQGKSSFLPMAIGSQHRAISHQLPAAASHIRRPRRPQLPPLVYCSIKSTREPKVSPSQNMNENSHERRNNAQPPLKANPSNTRENTRPTVRL